MMMMRFSWLSWQPPDMSPEAELQLAQSLTAHGRGRLISAFLGFSESRFFAVHGTGLFYLGGTVVLACFVPVFAALFGIGFVIYYLSIPIALSRYIAWLNRTERKYRLPASATPSTHSPPDDNPFYEAVANEMEQGRIDKAISTRATANSAGDDKLAKSLYIRYRAQALLDVHTRQSSERYEAQILERERQKQQERQAHQATARAFKAAAREHAEKRQKRFLKALAVVVVGVILFVIIFPIIVGQLQSDASSFEAAPQPRLKPSIDGQQQPDTSNYAAIPQPHQNPSTDEHRTALQQQFADLQAEYDDLTKRRANLDLNNTEQVSTFNRHVAEYDHKLKQAQQTQTNWSSIQDDWKRTQRENAEQQAKWLKQHRVGRQ